MPDLVALDRSLLLGAGFVDALQAAWDAGHAVLPLDPRLPRPAVDLLLEAFRPSTIVGIDGRHRRGGHVRRTGGCTRGCHQWDQRRSEGGRAHPRRGQGIPLATSDRLEIDAGTDRWLACLPLAHIGGLSVVTRSLLTGTPVTVLERFDPAEVERQASMGATRVSMVPTALLRTDTSGYRTVLLGGATPPGAVAANVVSTYGLTETGSGVVYDGRPLEGVELRIGDRTTGQVGEVLVRAPMSLRAYRDGSDPKLAGGWLPTGDGGRLAADGTLTVFGRMAEVIVTGGEKVWPAPVEEVLSRHPGIDQVAVWKRPDGEWGERIVAWVVPKDPSAPPGLDELRDLVAANLARWAAPRQVVVVDSLPRTPSGKVRRTALP